jgi:hypothetical protein
VAFFEKVRKRPLVFDVFRGFLATRGGSLWNKSAPGVVPWGLVGVSHSEFERFFHQLAVCVSPFDDVVDVSAVEYRDDVFE